MKCSGGIFSVTAVQCPACCLPASPLLRLIILYYWPIAVRIHRALPAPLPALQNGRFDAPDRLFWSVADTWKSVLTLPSDVKELVPEFYSNDPSFLVSTSGGRGTGGGTAVPSPAASGAGLQALAMRRASSGLPVTFPPAIHPPNHSCQFSRNINLSPHSSFSRPACSSAAAAPTLAAAPAGSAWATWCCPPGRPTRATSCTSCARRWSRRWCLRACTSGSTWCLGARRAARRRCGRTTCSTT